AAASVPKGAATGDGERDTYSSTSAVTMSAVNTAARHLSDMWDTRRRAASGSGVQRGASRAVSSDAPDSAARMLESADCIWRAVSYRSSGTLFNAFVTTRSSDRGRDGTITRSGLGSVVRTW